MTLTSQPVDPDCLDAGGADVVRPMAHSVKHIDLRLSADPRSPTSWTPTLTGMLQVIGERADERRQVHARRWTCSLCRLNTWGHTSR